MNHEPDPTNEPDDPWLVDRLLDDPATPFEGAAAGVADLVSALTAPATAAELTAEETYLQLFDSVAAEAGAETQDTTSTEGKPMRTIVIGSRAAIAAAVAVIAVSGAAAAFTGTLPGSLQASAHRYLGAPTGQPAADPSDSPSDEPTGTPTETGTAQPTSGSTASRTAGIGPDATGPAAVGLCTAWTHGGLATTSVAYRNLQTAAGGSTGITAYCAGVFATGKPGSHGTGSPTSHPTGSPTDHPTGSPTQHVHPTGSPTQHVHPAGSPSSHPGHH